MQYSIKITFVRTIFTFTVFEILLFECRLVLGPAQWLQESKRIKFSMKNQNRKTASAKPTYHLKAYPILFKNVLVKTIFAITVFEIFLFECRSVLGHARWVQGSERVKFIFFTLFETHTRPCGS